MVYLCSKGAALCEGDANIVNSLIFVAYTLANNDSLLGGSVWNANCFVYWIRRKKQRRMNIYGCTNQTLSRSIIILLILGPIHEILRTTSPFPDCGDRVFSWKLRRLAFTINSARIHRSSNPAVHKVIDRDILRERDNPSAIACYFAKECASRSWLHLWSRFALFRFRMDLLPHLNCKTE